MLYRTYQFHDDAFEPIRVLAQGMRWFAQSPFWGFGDNLRQQFAAALEMISRFEITHSRPDFAIATVAVGNREVPVTIETELDLPFGKLLRFAKDMDTPQPRVLVVAPLSGHFATLLRGTIETLLRDHDVYVTDWANARDVPLAAGSFGVDDYVAYLIRFLETIGPGGHILAVCQPCVQALAAVAVMSADRHPATPRSMTLMAGPIDPRESPTAVNEFAVKKSLAWFESAVIASVPPRFAGGGRRVYPGFLQSAAFMAMNMERHRDRPSPAVRPSRQRRDRRGRKDQELLRRVFRGARPHRGILHRDHRPYLPEGRAGDRRLQVSRRSGRSRARSATPRC